MSDEENIEEQSADDRPQLTENENLSEPSTINYQSSTNMEVHKHPHHITHKKKWGEYLLEFFMLFLAVFLGFVAENVRENSVNKEREKHYMENLVRELKMDTSRLYAVLYRDQLLLNKMDSAVNIPVEMLTNIDVQDTFYHHFIFFYSWISMFSQHDNTLNQLKNAGGFSVVRNFHVLDSIDALQAYYQLVKTNQDFYLSDYKKVVDLGEQLLITIDKATSSNDPFYNTYPKGMEVFTQYQKPLLQQLYSCIRTEENSLQLCMENRKDYLIRAALLISFINNEYHLEN